MRRQLYEIVQAFAFSLRGLDHVVECNDGMGGFNPIAAFNSERIAKNYMRACAGINKDFRYRYKKVGA